MSDEVLCSPNFRDEFTLGFGFIFWPVILHCECSLYEIRSKAGGGGGARGPAVSLSQTLQDPGIMDTRPSLVLL
jgi:hypothetical protein